MVLAPLTAYAKPVYVYLEGVENQLLNRNFKEAYTTYSKLPRELKNFRENKTGDSIQTHFNEAEVFLKQVDKVNTFLEKASKAPQNYKAIDIEITNIATQKSISMLFLKTDVYNSTLFSRTFGKELHNLQVQSLDKFQKTAKIIENHHRQRIEANKAKEQELLRKNREEKKKQNEDRIAAREQAEQERRERQRHRELKRESEKNKLQAEKEKEMEEIDTKSKMLGFKGYSRENLVSMIHKTQKEGGLENYLNKVVGCTKNNNKPCKKWYPKVKAIQILNEGVLYSFSEFNGSNLFSFIIYVERELGKIYQEGQALDNSFLVFTGMLSYSTVTGIEKSVPQFRRVKINNN